MPRAINKKCQGCASLSIAESRKESCWVEDQCKNRRNYYRSRAKKLQSKNKSYALTTGKIPTTEFEIVPDTYRAELVMGGACPNKLGQVKGGVGWFQILIYRGSKLVSQSNKVLCKGMVQSDLEEAIDLGLEKIKELYDISAFGQVSWRPML